MYCYYKNVRRRKGKKILSIILTILIILSLYFYYSARIVSSITEYSKVSINSSVTTSVNNAVLISLESSVSYDDLVVVQKDKEGNIALLASNSYKINIINREIVKNSQIFLDIDCKKGIRIPFGTLTGISILSGYGKSFKFDLLAVGSVTSNFISDFSSVGINQTRHSIYIEIVSTINIVMPTKKEKVITKTRILICDTILVGKIPSVYLNGSLF